MKTIFKVISIAALLAVLPVSAYARPWIQASSTDEQLASDPKPKVITMNSTDGSSGMTQDKGVVTANENGTYFVIAAAQVGGSTKGLVRLWMRINGKDVDNSNTEQLISDPAFTTVLVCQGLLELKKGDKVVSVYSGTVKGVGLVVKKPAGEPVVPSIILSAYKID